MDNSWLSVTWLKNQHREWSIKLANANIFNKILTTPKFEIKYGVKTFAGQHVWKRNNVTGEIEQKIRITPYNSKFTENDILDTLLHEMIHQYIFEAGIIDTSSHGRVFKRLMNEINQYLFESNENFEVTASATRTREYGEGFKTYYLLIYRKENRYIYAVISQNKLFEFNAFATRLYRKGKIQAFGWFTSKDKFFDSVTKCVKSLTGYYINDLKDFACKFNVEKYKLIEDL